MQTVATLHVNLCQRFLLVTSRIVQVFDYIPPAPQCCNALCTTTSHSVCARVYWELQFLENFVIHACSSSSAGSGMRTHHLTTNPDLRRCAYVADVRAPTARRVGTQLVAAGTLVRLRCRCTRLRDNRGFLSPGDVCGFYRACLKNHPKACLKLYRTWPDYCVAIFDA